MAPQSALIAHRISFQEFLAAYDGVRAEWVDGTVVEMSPASDPHQDILELPAAALRTCVERTRAGITRSRQPGMRIGNRLGVPDLLFLSTEHRHRRTATPIDGPADFVIEVASLESRLRDRDEKYHEYEKADPGILDRPRDGRPVPPARGRPLSPGRRGRSAQAGQRGASRILDRSALAVAGAAAQRGLAAGPVAAPVTMDERGCGPKGRTSGRRTGNGGMT